MTHAHGEPVQEQTADITEDPKGFRKPLGSDNE